MTATIQTAFKDKLLDAMMRNVTPTGNAVRLLELNAGGSAIKELALGSSDWLSAANGYAKLASYPRLLSNLGTGTITGAKMLDGPGGTTLVDSITAGLTGPEIILDTAAITGPGTPSSLQSMALYMPKTVGTVSLNLEFRNRILDFITGKNFTAKSSSGSNIILYMWGGSAPDPDVALPGSPLVTFSQPNQPGWAASSGGAVALSATVTALAGGTGTLAWGALILGASNSHVLVGSVGTAGTDFIVNTTSVTSGVTNVQLTGATITL